MTQYCHSKHTACVRGGCRSCVFYGFWQRDDAKYPPWLFMIMNGYWIWSNTFSVLLLCLCDVCTSTCHYTVTWIGVWISNHLFFCTLRMSPSWLWFINLMFLLGWLTDWLTDCVFECAHACVLVQTHAHTQVCMPMCTRVEAACGYLFFSIAPNWLLWDKISYWTLFSPFLSRQTG